MEPIDRDIFDPTYIKRCIVDDHFLVDDNNALFELSDLIDKLPEAPAVDRPHSFLLAIAEGLAPTRAPRDILLLAQKLKRTIGHFAGPTAEVNFEDDAIESFPLRENNEILMLETIIEPLSETFFGLNFTQDFQYYQGIDTLAGWRMVFNAAASRYGIFEACFFSLLLRVDIVISSNEGPDPDWFRSSGSLLPIAAQSVDLEVSFVPLRTIHVYFHSPNENGHIRPTRPMDDTFQYTCMTQLETEPSTSYTFYGNKGLVHILDPPSQFRPTIESQGVVVEANGTHNLPVEYASRNPPPPPNALITVTANDVWLGLPSAGGTQALQTSVNGHVLEALEHETSYQISNQVLQQMRRMQRHFFVQENWHITAGTTMIESVRFKQVSQRCLHRRLNRVVQIALRHRDADLLVQQAHIRAAVTATISPLATTDILFGRGFAGFIQTAFPEGFAHYTMIADNLNIEPVDAWNHFENHRVFEVHKSMCSIWLKRVQEGPPKQEFLRQRITRRRYDARRAAARAAAAQQPGNNEDAPAVEGAVQEAPQQRPEQPAPQQPAPLQQGLRGHRVEQSSAQPERNVRPRALEHLGMNNLVAFLNGDRVAEVTIFLNPVCIEEALIGQIAAQDLLARGFLSRINVDQEGTCYEVSNLVTHSFLLRHLETSPLPTIQLLNTSLVVFNRVDARTYEHARNLLPHIEALRTGVEEVRGGIAQDRSMDLNQLYANASDVYRWAEGDHARADMFQALVVVRPPAV